MVKRDYYIILGVPRSESRAGIREAFRKLAKKYHPDLGGPEATETFQEIAQAYEILSDPEQRRTYDQTLRRGESFLQYAEPLEQARRQGRYRAGAFWFHSKCRILHDFQTIHPSFDALFDRMLRNFTGIEVPKGAADRRLKYGSHIVTSRSGSRCGCSYRGTGFRAMFCLSRVW